jgi:hypothetical protein
MVIAHRPHAVAFPPLPRLAAHFTSAKELQFTDLDALQDGVRPMADVESQASEFFFAGLETVAQLHSRLPQQSSNQL